MWGNREVKELEQGHTAGRQQSWDFTPQLLYDLATSPCLEFVLNLCILESWSYSDKLF